MIWPDLATSLLEFGIFFRHVGKGLFEYRNFVLDAETYVGVVVECFVAGFVDVGGLQEMVLYRSSLGTLTRQYQLRCFTSALRKMMRPVLSS